MEMQELFGYGQGVTALMVEELNFSYEERLNFAFAMSRVTMCSVRIRKSTQPTTCYHVINHVLEFPSKNRVPFFTVTFEEVFGDDVFDVSLGFCKWESSLALYQAEGCFDCGDEEFCSQQTAEADRESFNFYHPQMEIVINSFARYWSPLLAELAGSFDVETMYESTGFILDQVYDSWSDISEELESTIRLFTFNERSGLLVKDPEYCSKDGCEDLAYERGLCTSHEDLCVISDCFDYKDEGRFCYSHAEQ